MAGSDDRNGGWSLRRRLAFGLVLAALLPAILFSTAFLWVQWHSDHQNLIATLDAGVRLNAGLIDDFIESEQAAVSLLAEDLSDEPDAGVHGVKLAGLLSLHPAMLRVIEVNADGDMVAARDARGRELPLLRGRARNTDWFAAARDRYRPHVTNVYRFRAFGDEAVIGISAPVLEGGRFKGALLAAIPIESLLRQSAESAARSRLELLLLDRDLRVIFASHGLRPRVQEHAGAAGDALAAAAKGAEQVPRELLLRGLLKDDDMAHAQAVRMRNGWTLALIAPRARLVAPLWPRLVLLAALLVVTLLGAMGVLAMQWRVLGNSIDVLRQSLRGYVLGGRMGSGRMRRLPDELQPLARGIGELGERMNAAYAQVQRVLKEREEVIAERTESLNAAVAELSRQSKTDALTGALNYRGFREACEQIWDDPDSQPLSVLALDIDHFKHYNDLYGHAEGDVALRRFAGAVRSALFRSGDVLARPGGEEFAILMPDCSPQQAMQVAVRVCTRVREADISHDDTPSGRLTVSIGVAARSPDDAGIDALLKRADEALYRAKSAGRDRASV